MVDIQSAIWLIVNDMLDGKISREECDNKLKTVHFDLNFAQFMKELEDD